MDTTLESPSTSNETIRPGSDLPVKLDTLLVDGIRPDKGDSVEVTVKGTVSKIVDDCAYVSLETANDEPIEDKSSEMKEQSEDDLMSMAEKADMGTVSPYG